MSTYFRASTNDLPAASRQTLEQLLGVPLSPHQRITICLEAPGVPDDAQRAAAAERLTELLAAVKLPAGVTDAELDEAVEEAMQHVRPRRS